MREPVACGTHLLWFLFSIPAAAFLLKLAQGKRLLIGIYTIGLVSCFASSAAFHGSYYHIDSLMTLDHVCIYLLIAGTYTPVLCFTQNGYNKIVSLCIIWVGCLSGIFIRIFLNKHIESLYLITSLLPATYPPVLNSVFKRGNSLVLGGGATYITGALINFYQRDSLFCHDVFHVFVMAASLMHYIFILKLVLLSREGRVCGARQNFAKPSPPPLRTVGCSSESCYNSGGNDICTAPSCLRKA